MIDLVVHADDGGFAPSTDDAILHCFERGVVRSASVAVNGPTADRFVERALGAGLDLGLHLNLTEGPALAGPAKTLTDAAGRFPGDKRETWRRAAAGRLDASEVGAEVEAQWERLAALGVRPSHVDGHNHVHLFPVVRETLRDLAAGLWVRCPLPESGSPAGWPEPFEAWATAWRSEEVRCIRSYAGFRFAADPDEEVFLRSLPSRGSPVEFMVHPGSRPGSGFAASPLRDREAEILCAPSLVRALEGRGVRLRAFPELQ